MGNGKRNKRVEGYEELGRREKLGEEIKKKKKKTCRGEREKKQDKHKERGWV